MDRQAGVFIFTHDLLQSLLKIPDNHKVVRVYSNWDEPYTFNVVVEGPDLIPVFEGEVLPRYRYFPEKWLEKKED